MRVRSKSRSSITKTGQDVDYASGEAGLVDELTQSQSTQRGLFSGLENAHRTSSYTRTLIIKTVFAKRLTKTGGKLPGSHQQGEVPGNNLSSNTNRFPPCVGEELVGGDGNRLAYKEIPIN